MHLTQQCALLYACDAVHEYVLLQGVKVCLAIPVLLHTGGLGAVFRTVLETMRTLFVWLVDLLLFYTPLGLGKLGESWSAWSFLQAAG